MQIINDNNDFIQIKIDNSWQSQSISSRNLIWALPNLKETVKIDNSWQSQSFSARNLIWALPNLKETVK